MLHDPVGGQLQHAQPTVGRHPGEWLLPVADRPQHVGPNPRRVDGGHLVDDFADGEPSDRPIRLHAARRPDRLRQLRTGPADSFRFGLPADRQIGHAVPGLLVAGVLGRLPLQRRTLEASRCPPIPIHELLDVVGERLVDLDAALRERLQQIRRDAGDLRLSVHNLTPGEPEPGGELRAQQRLIQPAQHALMTLQVSGVQREPAAIQRLRLRGDDGVGVDLGVVISRRRLPERRDRQLAALGMQPPTVDPHPGRRPEPLPMLEHLRHGGVVGGEQPGVAGQRPPHAQRLGS
jgi:hypothetical protein